MPNPRLAGRYAKSLIDLAIERDELDIVYKDMLYLDAVCKQSREFMNVLKSPVISPDKKVQILDAVTTGNIGELVATFSHLLIKKIANPILRKLPRRLLTSTKISKVFMW